MALPKQLFRMGSLAGSLSSGACAVGSQLQAMGWRSNASSAGSLLFIATVAPSVHRSGTSTSQGLCAGAVAPLESNKRFYASGTSFNGSDNGTMLCNKVFRCLPSRVILVRAGEAEPHSTAQGLEGEEPSLSDKGEQQAEAAAGRVIEMASQASSHPQVFIYSSPLRRAMDTAGVIQQMAVASLGNDAVLESSVQESPQLREQDWLNLCTLSPSSSSTTPSSSITPGGQPSTAISGKTRDFYMRAAEGGESAADVYDRLTLFQDHLIRDMTHGRFGQDGSVVLVTHARTLRVFLMRWLHWSVRQFVDVHAPPAGSVVVLEKVHDERLATSYQPFQPAATKPLYRLSAESLQMLAGATEAMAGTHALWARDSMARAAKKKAVGSLTW